MGRRGHYHKQTYLHTIENVCLEVKIVKANCEYELYKKVNDILNSDSRWYIADPFHTTYRGYGNKLRYSIKLEKNDTVTKTKEVTLDRNVKFEEMWDNYMAKF